MMQLALQLGQEGAELAAARANRAHADWSEKALVAWYDYARTHQRFTAEDVRLSCLESVPPAPDNRAWGALPRVAIKQGMCKRIGITHAKSAHCHGTWIAEYESLIFCGSVAK
jgi:hypothetical protein